MKHGSSYNSLDGGLRAAIAATMMYYQVDGEDKKFVKLLESIINDIKEGKQVCGSVTFNKEFWDK